MIALHLVVCIALLAASALATNVQQCPGLSREFENLSDNVQLTPCKKPPCKLKRGTNQAIAIKFVTEIDVAAIKNSVSANVAGLNLPFIGVDGASICDKVYMENGEKASCPLKAGTKYTYKDTFPIHSFYPPISTRVHWGLQDTNKKDIICFEVSARIV